MSPSRPATRSQARKSTAADTSPTSTTSSQPGPSTSASGGKRKADDSPMSSKKKGKQKARSVSPVPSNSSLSDESGRLTPLASHTATSKKSRASAPLKQDEGWVASPTFAYRVRYAGEHPITPGAVHSWLSERDISVIKVDHLEMGSGGRQEPIGPRNKNGYIAFDAAEKAKDLVAMSPVVVGGVEVVFKFASSNFNALKNTPIGNPSPQASREELARTAEGRRTVKISPLPTSWGLAELAKTFVVGNSAFKIQGALNRRISADSNEWFITFTTPELAAKCIIRFESQTITTVLWAGFDLEVPSGEHASGAVATGSRPKDSGTQMEGIQME
ncbi:hypothetical protein OC846_006311 [Tilletia horrida]|uniref:Uncharacterized protein n=1 Tax=Tilletia horrida TaxID=155126 RepID=A0AAN6JQS6_9BASI|nr:hypothetical protein OC845_006256 [Tilletia horrida]KAK0543733.1 hypothetical protein OC846_006311 [Tilletia horrida]